MYKVGRAVHTLLNLTRECVTVYKVGRAVHTLLKQFHSGVCDCVDGWEGSTHFAQTIELGSV